MKEASERREKEKEHLPAVRLSETVFRHVNHHHYHHCLFREN